MRRVRRKRDSAGWRLDLLRQCPKSFRSSSRFGPPRQTKPRSDWQGEHAILAARHPRPRRQEGQEAQERGGQRLDIRSKVKSKGGVHTRRVRKAHEMNQPRRKEEHHAVDAAVMGVFFCTATGQSPMPYHCHRRALAIEETQSRLGGALLSCSPPLPRTG